MNERTSPIPEPDEQFIDALEEQLRSGIRRRTLLDPHHITTNRSLRKGLPMMATLSLMLLSLTLGATGTLAVVHHDPAPQRELYMQKATLLLDRAAARLEQYRADLDQLRPLIERGMVNQASAAGAEQKVKSAEAALMRRELNLAETRITGCAPVDDLTAPLIDGRDFITGRMNTRHAALAFDIQRRQTALDRVTQLVQSGIVHETELTAASTDLATAQRALLRLTDRLDLRAAFVSQSRTAHDVELRAMLQDAQAELAVASNAIEAAQVRARRLAALHSAGAVTAAELRVAESALRSAQSSLALAEIEVRMIAPLVAPGQGSK